MTETLFERYKEALRAGHVAVVRGRLEQAAAAYREAISIAPDRPVPRSALGRVHLRLGDPVAALEACDSALTFAPDDEAALRVRAQALVVLRRTAEAAETYDHLADVGSATDRPAVAAEAARRAVAIEPTDARRARHAALVEHLAAGAGSAVAPDEAPVVDEEGAGAEGGAATDGVAADMDRVEAEAGVAAAQVVAELPPDPDPEALIAAAADARARGDTDAAADAALAAARAYQGRGHVDAAFDACLQGIGARPADVELHLLLADLAVGRGWTAHAGDTYRSLLYLADLDGDAALGATIRTAAAEHLPGDPRFNPA